MVAEQLGNNTKEQMSHASSDVIQHGYSAQSDDNRVLTPDTLNCSVETFDAARCLLNLCRRASIQTKSADSRNILTVGEDEGVVYTKDHQHHFD
jgi:hypothetical protein